MDRNPPSAHPRLIPGGLIRLQTRLTHPSIWLAPAWATLCGVVASNAFGGRGQDWLRAALLIFLVEGGWGTLWSALSSCDWAPPLRRWRNWRFGEPLTAPPYTLPNTPGDEAARWLGQLWAWGRDVLWPSCGPALTAVAVALPVTAVLAAVLGRELLLLSVAALAVMQLGLTRSGRRGGIGAGWTALVALALPWLAGHLAFARLTLPSAALALAFALAWESGWYTDAFHRHILVFGQLLSALLLVVLHHPLAGASLTLCLAPQVALLLWLQRGQPVSWYVRNAQPWLMAAMLIAAAAL